MDGAVVLFSGGMDSTVALYWAKRRFGRVEAVSVDYGQRHRNELDAACAVAASAGVGWRCFSLPVLADLADSALVEHAHAVDAPGPRSDTGGVLPANFVPGRNVFLLAVAASSAVKLGIRHLVAGMCATDHAGYPDCREPFLRAMESALTLAMPSSCGPLELHLPLLHVTKSETVRIAQGLPGCMEALALSRTCYEGRPRACGTCSACLRRAEGFATAGVGDPALFATQGGLLALQLPPAEMPAAAEPDV